MMKDMSSEKWLLINDFYYNFRYGKQSVFAVITDGGEKNFKIHP